MKNVVYLFLLISQVFLAQNTFEKGNALYQKGEYQEAIETYEAIIKQNKQHSAMYTEVFDRLRKIEQSIAVLQATRPSKVSGWTVAAVVITALIAAITFINEISVPTP